VLFAAGALAGTALLAVPGIDLAVARVFYSRDTGFIGQHLVTVRALRQAYVVLYFGTVALCLAGATLTWRNKAYWLKLDKRHWLFLAACLAGGPGLVANVILKDHWGRARPRHIVEFGGSKTFTPPLLPSNQCPRNCSFISGEAASTYVVFYAAAVLFPQWAATLVVAGTLAGLTTGLVRMSQGAHFLSDIVFAGLFMALIVLLLRWLMLRDVHGAGSADQAPSEPAPVPPT
jgi:lipid A 4'-phosphatase